MLTFVKSKYDAINERDMKIRVIAIIICAFCSMGAIAQEISKDTIFIMKESVSLSTTPKNELSKQSLIKDHTFKNKKDIYESVKLDRGVDLFIAPEGNKKSEASNLPFEVGGGASSGFIVGVHHSLLLSNSKTLRLNYEIVKKLSLSMGSTIGNTSVPWLQFPTNQYSVFWSLYYNPIASVLLSTSINMGSLMGERYFNPIAKLVYTPNQNWELTIYGGAYFSPMHYEGQIYNAIYGGIKAKYTTNMGVFFYGKGSISKSNLPYNGWSPNALFNGYSSIGGGVGYKNMGVGANYNFNPLTGRSRVTYELSYDL